jgi:hypothetical protein
MARLEATGVVDEDGLTFTRQRAPDGEPLRIQIHGRIRCASGAMLAVDKWLTARRRQDNRLEVPAYTYSYHAWMEGSGRELLRYDNAHGELRRHFFDSQGNDVGVVAISLEELPTLDVVIEEAVALARDDQPPSAENFR